jgi:hypothetical protein
VRRFWQRGWLLALRWCCATVVLRYGRAALRVDLAAIGDDVLAESALVTFSATSRCRAMCSGLLGRLGGTMTR